MLCRDVGMVMQHADGLPVSEHCWVNLRYIDGMLRGLRGAGKWLRSFEKFSGLYDVKGCCSSGGTVVR